MALGNIHVMQVIFALEFGGAESLALNVCSLLREDERFSVSLCGVFGSGGPLSDVASQRGVSVFSLDAGRLGKVRTVAQLFRCFRQEKVAVAQVHGAYLLQYVMPAALLAGVAVVYTEHARHSLGRHAWLRRLARLHGRLFGKMVCVSRNLRGFMIDVVGLRPDRIEVISNGIDLSRFAQSAQDLSRKSGGVVIGTVARLTEAKDHGNLLRAFATVRKEVPDVRLLLVGDGELRQEVESLVSSLGLEDAVEMTGKRSDIPQLLAGMDIFVLPSRREGFPVSIIEAMACGRPVVATDVGGVREIIDDGVDGIVVPPEDAAALAAAILGLVRDPDGRSRLGERAVHKAAANFSDQTMIGNYMRLFTSVGGARA
jgi:glycosyltransferase involved in cell wall biosynthesis